MNERIDELAAQAGLHKEWFIDNPEIEKFAELIIQECADTAYHFFYDDAEGQQISAREAILSKFGLE